MSLNLDSNLLARKVRSNVLQMVYRAQASHVGSCFSVVDIIAVLYATILNIKPDDSSFPDRDRFILSKGHAAAAVYATLAEVGIIDKDILEDYGRTNSPYMTHVSHKIDGVEFSTGALGHGLPFAVGKALAAQAINAKWRVYVVLSDGEMDEGSNWEALMFASHHKLSCLTAIIDYNKLQSLDSTFNTLNLEPLVEKLEAFGWHVTEVDGHDHQRLKESFITATNASGPSIIVAHTIKGKGVSFMENKVEWHYKSPTLNQLNAALQEVGDNNA